MELERWERLFAERTRSGHGNALAAVLALAIATFIFVQVRGAVSDASEPSTPPAQSAPAPADTVPSPVAPDTQ